MKTLATILAFSFLAFSSTACLQFQRSEHTGGFGGKTVKASKNYVTKDVRVDNFTGLSIAGSPEVTYTQVSGKPKVEVYTSDNIVDLLDIRVKDGTLIVGFKKGFNVSYNKLNVRVSSETLKSIAIAGSGDIKLTNGLKTDDLRLSVAGSGDMEANNISCKKLDVSVAGSGDIKGNNINCTNLKTSVAGSGDLKLNNVTSNDIESSVAGSGTTILSGTAQEANFRVAGSGDLFASDLQTKRVSASVAGSGDIKCHAIDALKARASGSGSIGYKGSPQLDVPKKGLYKL